MLSLPYVNVSDGLWHVVRVSRHGNQVVLRLDSGEGKYYTESMPQDAHRLIYIGDSFAAADLYYPNRWHTEPQVNKDLIQSEPVHYVLLKEPVYHRLGVIMNFGTIKHILRNVRRNNSFCFILYCFFA